MDTPVVTPESVPSLLLLQPDDQIKEECKFMSAKTLSRFMTTNKRIYYLCKDIMVERRKTWEKNHLLRYFHYYDIQPMIFTMKGSMRQSLTIHHEGFSRITRLREHGSNLMDPYMSDFFKNVASDRYTEYIIGVDKLTDQLKLDLLKHLKSLGYNRVSYYELANDKLRYTGESLYNFSII